MNFTASILPVSYSFEIILGDAVLSFFVTPMECQEGNVCIDIWCPEDARYNRRTRVSQQNYNRQALGALLRQIVDNTLQNNDTAICP